MKRRKFITSGALAASPLTFNMASPMSEQDDERSLIEWRTYRIRFRGDASILTDYLEKVYQPALRSEGVDQSFLFRDYSLEEPVNLYLAINYPNTAMYLKCQTLIDRDTFLSDGDSYHSITEDQRIYNGFESWLLYAFEGFPSMSSISKESGLFELRTYEGYSEDAVRRKIRMFNDEEIDLFKEVGFNSVYFGDMIAGPHRPSLSYMIQFIDLEERNAQWKTFFDHPEWKRMVALPKYANSVSYIHKRLLIPA